MMNVQSAKSTAILVAWHLFHGCGLSETPENTTSREGTSWQDLFPIISETCAASGCHNSSDARGGVVFEGISESDFRQSNAKARLESSIAPMPPLSEELNPNQVSLSAEDRSLLLEFLADN